MRKENPENIQSDKLQSVRPRGFLRESSVMDTSDKFSDLSLQKLTSGNIRKFAGEILNIEETRIKRHRQQEFLLNLMPEIFHDVRSPFISIIGFAGIFKQRTHSDKEIGEYSGEIIEESHSALKRLEALEHFFRLFLELDSKKLEKLDLIETLEWIFTLLHVKISRKKLKIVKKIDKNLKNSGFLTYVGNVKLLIFELLCRMIVEAGNKTTLVLKAVGGDDHISVSILAEPAETVEEIKLSPDFRPAFELDSVVTKIVPGQGFLSVIKREIPQ